MRELYDLWTVLGNELWMCRKENWSSAAKERLQAAKDELRNRGIMEQDIEDFIQRTRKTFLVLAAFFLPFFIQAQPKITAAISPGSIIKVNLLKDTNYVVREWVDKGKPDTRKILTLNISIFNGYSTNFLLADYQIDPSLFCYMDNRSMLKNFFELTLADHRGYIVRERVGCCRFDWSDDAKPSIPAGGMVSSTAGVSGAVMDVTGVKDGDYFISIRLNPSAQGFHTWPKQYFVESGSTVPIRISNGKVSVRTDAQPKKIMYKPPPKWIRDAVANSPRTIPSLPTLSTITPRPTKK